MIPMLYPGRQMPRPSGVVNPFPRPIFEALLQVNLFEGVTGVSASYTNASADYTRTVKDHEGLIRYVKSNESRFEGARRVENLTVASEDMTNGAYDAQNGASVDSATEASFDGTNNGFVRQIVNITDDGSGAGGRTFVFSVELRLVSGTLSDPDSVIAISGSAIASATQDYSGAITSEWKRLSVTASTDAAGTTVEPLVRCDDSGVTLGIRKWQLEEVTGQSNQNPSEYVSTGVGTGSEVWKDTPDSVGSGWTDNGDATYTADGSQVSNSAVSVNTSLKTGKDVVVTFTVSGRTAGQIRPAFDSGQFGTYVSADGTYSETFTMNIDNPIVYVFADVNFSGTVSLVSVKEADHGANRDGVRYFPYANANSVSSGVVTEAQGAALTTLKGYLIEGARTNILLQSNDLSTTWVNSNSVDAQNYATAPDGSKTANRIIDNSATGTGSVFVFQTVTTWSASTAYSVTAYLKQDQLSWGRLQVGSMGALNLSVYYDLSNGLVGSSGANVTNTFIESAGNGWYRCGFSFTSDAADTTADVLVYAAEADNDSVVDLDGTSSILYWQGDVQAGSFPSTPIPTGASAVARNADVLTYSAVGIADSFPMTISAEVYQDSILKGTVGHFVNINDDSSSDVIRLLRAANDSPQFQTVAASSVEVNITGPSDLVEGGNVITGALSTTESELYLGGVSIGTHGSSTAPTGLVLINIGSDQAEAAQPFAPIKNVKIFNKRLIDAQVAAL